MTQDNDERLFPFVTFDYSSLPIITASEDSRLSVDLSLDPAAAYPLLWYNTLLPYTRDAAVLACPDDDQPTLSPDNRGTLIDGQFTVPRSYIANRSAEGLSLAQIADPVETMVITEKWGYAHEESEGGDLWLESFKGDFNPDPAQSGYMQVASNRHQDGINCVFLRSRQAVHPQLDPCQQRPHRLHTHSNLSAHLSAARPRGYVRRTRRGLCQ